MNVESVMFLSIGLLVGFILGALVIGLIMMGKTYHSKNQAQMDPTIDETQLQLQIGKLQFLLGKMQQDMEEKQQELDQAHQKIEALNQQQTTHDQVQDLEPVTLETQDQQLEEAKQMIHQLNESLAEEKQRAQNLEQTCQEKDKLLKTASMAQTDLQDESMLLNTLMITQTDLEKAHVMISNFSSQIKELEGQLELKEEALLQEKHRSEQIEVELNQTHQTVIELQSKNEIAQVAAQELEHLKSEYELMKEQSDQKPSQDELLAHSAMLEDAKLVIDQLDNALNATKHQLKEASVKNEMLEKKLNEKQQDYEIIQNQLQQAVLELQNKQIENETHAHQLAEIEEKVEQAKQKIGQAQQEVAQYESALKEVQMSLEKQVALTELSEAKRRENLEQMNKMMQNFYKQSLSDLEVNTKPESDHPSVSS